VVLIALGTQFSFAQSEKKLIAYTSVFLTDQKTENVKISLKNGGKTVNTYTLNNERKIEIALDYHKDYILTFEKEGYVSKEVSFDTKHPSEFSPSNREIIHFEMELFKTYDKVDLSVFDNPVAKIGFDPSKTAFDYDMDYSRQIRPKIDKARRDLDKRRRDIIKEEKAAIAKAEEDKRQQELAKLEAEAEKREYN